MMLNALVILSLSYLSVILAAPISLRCSADAPEPFVLPKPTEGPGPTFDATATRAATKAQIRSAAAPDHCFDVSDFRAGDFRFNLVPLALKKCDPTVEGQRFDLIPKGEHNNVPDGSRVIIVSSQQLTCIDRRGNKNDRSRPGLFACGGRAAGDGETTGDQQFFFNPNTTISQLSTQGIAFPVVNAATNNGVGPGNTCLTFNADGFVSNAPCSPPNFTPEQRWFVEEVPVGDSEVTPSDQSENDSTTTIATQSATLILTSAASSITPAVTTPTTTVTSSAILLSTSTPEIFHLPPPGPDGPGPTFDSTAVRPVAKVQLRSASTTSPNLCFDVSDFRSGDFRFNLVPVALKTCDASVEGQRFDLITKGEHNNTPDQSKTLLVSSQQLTCIDRHASSKDRNRPGLFACGGRGAGDGETTDDELFFFDPASISKGQIGFPLVRDAVNKGVGQGNRCLTLNPDGFLDTAPCSPPHFTPEQTWVIVN